MTLRVNEASHLCVRMEDVGLDDDKAGTFSGMASTTADVDSYGTVIAEGAFSKSLRERGKPAMLWQHDMWEVIGVWSDLTENSEGLRVDGELNLDVRRGAEAHSLLKQGALDGLSVGFIPRKLELPDEDSSDPVVITEADLYEISLVTFPANQSARIAEVRQMPGWTKKEMAQRMRDAGVSRSLTERAVYKLFSETPARGKPDRETVTAILRDAGYEAAIAAEMAALAVPMAETPQSHSEDILKVLKAQTKNFLGECGHA